MVLWRKMMEVGRYNHLNIQRHNECQTMREGGTEGGFKHSSWDWIG